MFEKFSQKPFRLGDLLIEKHLITQRQLATAIATQKEHTGQPLGQILIELGYISSGQLRRTLVKQNSLRILSRALAFMAVSSSGFATTACSKDAAATTDPTAISQEHTSPGVGGSSVDDSSAGSAGIVTPGTSNIATSSEAPGVTAGTLPGSSSLPGSTTVGTAAGTSTSGVIVVPTPGVTPTPKPITIAPVPAPAPVHSPAPAPVPTPGATPAPGVSPAPGISPAPGATPAPAPVHSPAPQSPAPPTPVPGITPPAPAPVTTAPTTTAPVTTPAPAPVQSPVQAPTQGISAPIALYSYTNDISTAVPLAGAMLEQKMVYLFWKAQGATQVSFYCCKGIDGDAVGEVHLPAITDASGPFGIAVDMSQFKTAGQRELYIDYVDANGEVHTDNYTNFSIHVAPPSSAPVALYSYTNDISTAVPLAGAVLEPKTVYLFWKAPNATEVAFYYGKGISGDASGEPHLPSVTDTSAPFGVAVDMSQFKTAGERELYIDYIDANGEMHSDNFTNFSVHVTAPPPVQPPAPPVQPPAPPVQPPAPPVQPPAPPVQPPAPPVQPPAPPVQPPAPPVQPPAPPVQPPAPPVQPPAPPVQPPAPPVQPPAPPVQPPAPPVQPPAPPPIQAPATYTALVSWDAPMQREDGSAMDPSEIDHYEIYYIASSTGDIEVIRVEGGNLEHRISNLPADTYNFSMVVTDRNGIASAMSAAVEVNVQ